MDNVALRLIKISVSLSSGIEHCDSSMVSSNDFRFFADSALFSMKQKKFPELSLRDKKKLLRSLECSSCHLKVFAPLRLGFLYICHPRGINLQNRKSRLHQALIRSKISRLHSTRNSVEEIFVSEINLRSSLIG